MFVLATHHSQPGVIESFSLVHVGGNNGNGDIRIPLPCLKPVEFDQRLTDIAFMHDGQLHVLCPMAQPFLHLVLWRVDAALATFIAAWHWPDGTRIYDANQPATADSLNVRIRNVGIASSTNDLYFNDSTNTHITHIDMSVLTCETIAVDMPPRKRRNLPAGSPIAVHAGRIYIADWDLRSPLGRVEHDGDNRVVIFNLGRRPTDARASQLTCTIGIAVDESYLYVYDDNVRRTYDIVTCTSVAEPVAVTSQTNKIYVLANGMHMMMVYNTRIGRAARYYVRCPRVLLYDPYTKSEYQLPIDDDGPSVNYRVLPIV